MLSHGICFLFNSFHISFTYIIHLCSPGTRKVVDTSMEICLPHELLHCLALTASPYVWSAVLGHLDGEAREGFFNHIKMLLTWKEHPAFNGNSLDLKKMIPLCIHTDGAQFYRNDENFVWSLSSAFGTKGTIKDVMLCKYPIAVIPEKLMRDPEVSKLKLVISNWFFAP